MISYLEEVIDSYILTPSRYIKKKTRIKMNVSYFKSKGYLQVYLKIPICYYEN